MYNLFVNAFLAVTAVTAVMAAVVEGGQQFSTAEYTAEGTFIPQTYQFFRFIPQIEQLFKFIPQTYNNYSDLFLKHICNSYLKFIPQA